MKTLKITMTAEIRMTEKEYKKTITDIEGQTRKLAETIASNPKKESTHVTVEVPETGIKHEVKVGFLYD